MTRLLAILFTLLAVVAIAACREREAATPSPTQTSTPAPISTATSEPTPSGSVKLLKADLPRTSPSDVTANELQSVADGETSFAFDLFQQMKDAEEFRGGNLFYSPLSISLALAMTHSGAGGATASQMASALHLDLPTERLNPALNLLDQKLAGNEEFELAIANSLWGQDGFAFKQAFLESLARDYGAGLRLVDFIDAAHREAARQAINEWVENETKDRIRELVPSGALTDMTRLVLANAIYFKAEWTFQFSKDATHERPFRLAEGATVNVPTMSRANMSLRYADFDRYQVVELPYKGTEVSMLVILPDPGQFTTIEQSLDAQHFAKAGARLESRRVSVTMPKFEFTSEVALKKYLQALGVTTAFDPGQADFSGIADPATGVLYIQDALHKAFVKVDEEGTEAAAATAIIVGTTSVQTDVVEFTVDRPFLFVIRDGQTGTTLFVGRVMDPRSR